MVVVYTRTRVVSCRFPSPAMLSAAVVVVVLLMMNAFNCNRVVVLLMSNATYDRYCINNGVAAEHCLIAKDLELEILMDSHVSRMLVNHISTGTASTGTTGAPAKPWGNT